MDRKKFYREEDDDVPLHYLSEIDKSRRGDNILKFIQFLYIFFVVVWFVIIIALDLIPTNWIGWFILSLPIISFSISYCNIKNQVISYEKEMGQSNFLAFVSILALLVINWAKDGNRCKIFGIVLTSLVFLLITLLEYWINKDYYIVVKHFRIICQSIALTLLIYAIYTYYTEHICITDNTDKNK